MAMEGTVQDGVQQQVLILTVLKIWVLIPYCLPFMHYGKFININIQVVCHQLSPIVIIHPPIIDFCNLSLIYLKITSLLFQLE